LPASLGTALGAVVVWVLLDGSWPVRIGAAAVVLLVGLAILLWRARHHGPGVVDGTEPAGAVGQVGDSPSPAAYDLNSPDPQGDPTHD